MHQGISFGIGQDQYFSIGYMEGDDDGNNDGIVYKAAAQKETLAGHDELLSPCIFRFVRVFSTHSNSIHLVLTFLITRHRFK